MEALLRQGDRLARLIHQLLDVSRIEAGKLALEKGACELVSLARSSIEAAQARTDRHEITLRAPDSLEVPADPLRLEQVLANLLDNAIKYSPAGSAVEVRVARNGQDASITVADQGPGIAPEDRTRVFERFYRVDKARSREQGGTGLGLALAKWGVESHGGRIALESEPGRGSKFRIVLPIASEG